MKPIRFSTHAREQMVERGAGEAEVIDAIRTGEATPARRGRRGFRKNFQYNSLWGGRTYAIKQVLAIVAEERDALIVVTVYTLLFLASSRMRSMKITYDPQVDALYIRLLDGVFEVTTQRLSEDVAVNYTPDGRIVGIEVLDASSSVFPTEERTVALRNLTPVTG